jgi:hypothetical protein
VRKERRLPYRVRNGFGVRRAGDIGRIGSGTIFVTATESLDASIPGSGTIIHARNPEAVAKSVTGSGAIIGSAQAR